MDRLAAHLTTELALLEQLLFRLVTAHQLVLAGEGRFLGRAADELQAALDEVRHAEIVRATLVHDVLTRGARDPDRVTLAEIAAHAPEPHRSILEAQRDAMRSVLAEIEELVPLTGALASRGALAGADP